jgi:uncharacterized protein (DUF433 family)
MTTKGVRELSGGALNAEIQRVHSANERWWRDLMTGERLTNRNIGELVMLQISELAEAMEGHRKNLPDDKLPHRPMFEVELADALIRVLDTAGGTGVSFGDWEIQRHPAPSNVGEGLLHIADAMMRVYTVHEMWAARRSDQNLQSAYVGRTWQVIHALLDFAHHHGADIWGAYEEKLAYNARREDHTDEHRRSAHGKKY